MLHILRSSRYRLFCNVNNSIIHVLVYRGAMNFIFLYRDIEKKNRVGVAKNISWQFVKISIIRCQYKS
jgi:hypothetical protein